MVVEKKRKQRGKSRREYGGRGVVDAPAGSRFDVLREEVEEDERNEEDMTRLGENHNPGILRELGMDSTKGKNKKGKNKMDNIFVDKVQESGSRNSRPAKTTFGELFEYTSKAKSDEKIVSNSSSLDHRKHSVVRVEKESMIGTELAVLLKQPGDAPEVAQHRSDGMGVHEAMMVEPTVDRQETQVRGRPPDGEHDVFMRSVDCDDDHLCMEGVIDDPSGGGETSLERL